MTDPGSRRGQQWLVLVGLAAVAMIWAWQRAWVCDDAFITWRYSENFANGLGAVYNAGERVEGYSNPSWMLLCALAIRCGLDPVTFGQWLGIVCYGLLVPATWWVGAGLAKRVAGDAGGDSAATATVRFVPLAAVGVALHGHLRDFASCGLETLGFVLLVTLVAGVLVRATRPGHFAIASLLTIAAAVTRPDGGLIGALAGLCALGTSLRQRDLRPVIAFAVPGFLLFLPFLGARFLFYGELLPNTFYAKSAHDPYASQGWFYVQLFFNAYWVLWPALLLAVVLPLTERVAGARAGLYRIAVLAFGYLAFVIWVGGDFMFARFCLPVTPLLYVVLEFVVRRWLRGAATWVAIAGVAGATLLFHQRDDLYVTGQAVRGVADERAQYPESRTTPIRAAGKRLGELTKGRDLRVAFTGTQAMLVYEAKVPYALESVTGLTDHFLARQEIAERGHVAHEKGIFRSEESREYALRSQGVHLLLFDHPPWTSVFPFLKVQHGEFTFTLTRWDREVFEPLLAAEDFQVTDLDAYVAEFVRTLPQRKKAEKPIVQAHLGAFDLAYFRWRDDDDEPAAAARQAIVDWLR